MDGEKVILSGKDIYLHEDMRQVCRVCTGSVFIYIVHVDENGLGRRSFVRASEGVEEIPAYNYYISGNGRECFLLVPDPRAELEFYACADLEAVQLRFLERANIAVQEESFAKCVNQAVDRVRLQEQISFQSAREEEEKAAHRSFSLIYHLFHKDYGYEEHTPSALYNAVRFLCKQMRIPIVPFSTLVRSCGYNYSVEDIARLSHFAVREITLEENWFHADGGPLLAFAEKSGRPVVCLPVSPKKYVAHMDSETRVKVDAKTAASLSPKACMFYAPFPNKPMGAKDLAAFALSRLQARDVFVYLLMSLLGVLVGLLIPMLNQLIFDRFIPLGNRVALVDLCSVMLTCTLGNIAFGIVKNFSMLRGARSMEYAVQAAAFDRLFHLPQSFFEAHSSATLIKCASGAGQVLRIVAQNVLPVLLGALFSIFYLARMFGYSALLARTALIMLLISMLVTALLGSMKIRHENARLAAETDAETMLFQFLGGVQKIRLSGVEDRALYEYLRPYTESRREGMQIDRLQSAAAVFSSAATTVFSLILYTVMIRNDMQIALGDYLAFTSAFGMLSASMMQLVNCYLDYNMLIPHYQYVRMLLEQSKELREDAPSPRDISGNIEVNNLSFAYEADGPMVLKNISFTVKKGEYIGIVGGSGSGKSTLLRCLLGFETPNVGKIYYDGQDIESVDKRELRKRFGVVLQNGKLISGSIAENISIANPRMSREQVKEIIADVGLEEEVRRMPMGLETMLSENGGTISGGQMQRILIGRALANDPAILFFDEATSALDNVTQAKICEALEKRSITRIVIAHRLSTVENCDRIFVMQDGAIVETGRFADLMRQRGVFYALANRQIL